MAFISGTSGMWTRVFTVSTTLCLLRHQVLDGMPSAPTFWPVTLTPSPTLATVIRAQYHREHGPGYRRCNQSHGWDVRFTCSISRRKISRDYIREGPRHARESCLV